MGKEHDPSFEGGSRDKRDLGLHFSTLFDQDEDEAGEKYDLATGKPFDNSTERPDAYGLTVNDHLDDEDDYPEIADFTEELLKKAEDATRRVIGRRAVDPNKDLA